MSDNQKQDAAAEFARLVEIVARLRAPDGCPWDKEQTHESLRASLIEETNEVLEAIDTKNDASMCEELGDLLLQSVMHAQMASEEQRFDIADVVKGVSDKMVRRHPHVFGDREANTAEEVLKNWDKIKRAEHAHDKSTFTSRLDGIASTLSSLMLANKVSKKAARAGFEWPTQAELLDKVQEELDELRQGIANQDQQNIHDELGDLLFTVVNVARWSKVKPEIALHDTVNRFKRRFAHMEQAAAANGQELESLSPEQWEELWQAAKTDLENGVQ